MKITANPRAKPRRTSFLLIKLAKMWGNDIPRDSKNKTSQSVFRPKICIVANSRDDVENEGNIHFQCLVGSLVG